MKRASSGRGKKIKILDNFQKHQFLGGRGFTCSGSPPHSLSLSLSLQGEGHCLIALEGVAGHDLFQWDVGAGQEAHQADGADQGVLGCHQRGHAFPVEGYDLQDGREDECQEAAADGAHQRDDQVQLGDQDGQGALRRGGGETRSSKVTEGTEQSQERNQSNSINCNLTLLSDLPRY